jgi:7-keto-8-aminopelargonate synthetase-like enzyme
MKLLNSGIGNYVRSNGRKYTFFAGNNYLGLANHPDVKAASIKAVRKYGVNLSASRHTTGTSEIHLELEKQLSVFKEKEDSIVFASGYQGNGILLEILKTRYSAIFIDQYAHPSITGSIPKEISITEYYSHCDPNNLEQLLIKHKGCRPLIITDGIFALTGEIAPLDKIYSLAKAHNAILIVDDAHSTGILGKTGKGTPEHFNLHKTENIYQSETMSKALGGYGGFISGSREFINSIREKSSTYQASTALPPPIVGAGLASLKIITNDPGLRIRLLDMAGELRKEILRMGFLTTSDGTPIIPIMLSTLARAKDLSLFMENNGIIVPFINYPIKQEKFIVRITVSVNHTTGQAGKLLEILKKWKDKNGTN